MQQYAEMNCIPKDDDEKCGFFDLLPLLIFVAKSFSTPYEYFLFLVFVAETNWSQGDKIGQRVVICVARE